MLVLRSLLREPDGRSLPCAADSILVLAGVLGGWTDLASLGKRMAFHHHNNQPNKDTRSTRKNVASTMSPSLESRERLRAAIGGSWFVKQRLDTGHWARSLATLVPVSVDLCGASERDEGVNDHTCHSQSLALSCPSCLRNVARDGSWRAVRKFQGRASGPGQRANPKPGLRD